MGLLQEWARYFAGRLTKSPEIVASNLLPGISRIPPKRGSAEFLKAYSEVPLMRMVVGKIAQSVARAEWSVHQVDKDGEQGDVVANHPATLFMARGNGPGGVLDGMACRHITQTHLEIMGEAFWILQRDTRGMPAAYWPIPPHWVVDIPPPSMEERFYTIKLPTGIETKIGSRDIVYFRDPNPYQPYGRGSGTGMALGDELETSEYLALFTKSFFHNLGRPDVIISGTVEAPIGKEARIRLEQHWKEAFRGPGKTHQPFFAAHPLTVQQLTLDMQASQTVAVRNQIRDIVMQTWGIPPEVLGIVENSNRATIGAADFFMAKNIVDPRLGFMLGTVDAQVMPQYQVKGARGAVQLAYESPIEDDPEFIKSAMAQAPFAFSVNEHRALGGKDPLPNGAGEIYPWPIALLGKEDPSESGFGGGAFGVSMDEMAAIAKRTSPELPNGKLGLRTVAEIVALTSKPPALLTEIGALTTKAPAPLTESDILSVASSIDAPDVVAEIGRLFEALAIEIITEMGEDFIEGMTDELFFQQSMRMSEFVTEETAFKIRRIDDTSREFIRTTLMEGNELGENSEQLTDRIEHLFLGKNDPKAGGGRARAERIARTETTKMSGFAAQESIMQAGFPEKEWVAENDDRIRAEHRELDGKRVNAVEKFQVGPYTASAPGHFGVAGMDIECRCTLLAVPPGLPKDVKQPEEMRQALRLRAAIKMESAIPTLFQVHMLAFKLQSEVVLDELKRTLGA